MSIREFVDSKGERWRVWSTLPSSGGMLSSGYERGWLTFESDDALKRLAPIPSEWEAAPENALEQFCRKAKVVPRHTRAFDE